jgi:hypothetical protein
MGQYMLPEPPDKPDAGQFHLFLFTAIGIVLLFIIICGVTSSYFSTSLVLSTSLDKSVLLL